MRGTTMEKLQARFKEAIIRKARIYRGEPPVEVLQRRELLLRLLCSRGGFALQRRQALRSANGDWENQVYVEFWVPRSLHVGCL